KDAEVESATSPDSPGSEGVDPDVESALEYLQMLQEGGMFAGKEPLLAKMQELAKQGVHPMEVLQSMRRAPTEEKMEPVLASFDLEGITRYIADKACKKIVVMCGAGISTSAGIPDFRTPGTGLYDNLQRFNLPQAESIFELRFFRDNPGAFYELAREMWPGNFEPTPAHYFIRLLHDKGILLRCYSQNIDSLECRAGLPAEKLVAAHGNFDAAHVIDREPEVLVDINELKAALDKGEEGWQKLRAEKGGLVKPKIVFFGE
ncbi:sirt2, partial [Symbiodinium sp. CCMP2592]